MAKLPDPVKKKASKSGVSRSAAIKKAETATAKAERGPAKARYPKMTTVSGASEAAKRGAGAARNKMGGFGATAKRSQSGGTIRSTQAEKQGSRSRSSLRARGVEGGKKTASRYALYGAGDNLTYEDKAGSQRNRKRAIAKKQSAARAEAAKPKRVTRGGNTGGFGATRKRSQSGGTVRSTQGRAMSKAKKLY